MLQMLKRSVDIAIVRIKWIFYEIGNGFLFCENGSYFDARLNV
jgi:hypothetical protein